MDSFFKMDVFFVIASFGVIVITALAGAILFYVLRIVRGADRLVAQAEEEVQALRMDLAEARALAKKEGKQLRTIADLGFAALRRILKGSTN